MKKEILETSLKQFLKFGIREMSIQKLIEPLGISTKTVYKYFKNKEELLEQSLNVFHSQQYEGLLNYPRNQPAPSLLFDLWYQAVVGQNSINSLFYNDLHYYYPELGKKAEAAIEKKFTQQFLLIIQQGIEEGSVRKDILKEVALESIYVLFAAITRSAQFKKFRLSPHELFLNTITCCIRGFCTIKGAGELDSHILRFSKSPIQ